MTSAALSPVQRGLYFGGILSGYFATMFAIAGSAIFVGAAMTEMGGLTLLGLAFTFESLFRCAIIPLSAKLGERYTRKRLYMVGLALFTAGAVLCAVAWEPMVVVIARAVMGLAWGLFFANMVVMLSDVYPPEKAPKMNGYMQTIGFVSALVAAPVAGLFVDFLTWQWALYVTIPFAALAFVCMIFVPTVQEKSAGGKSLDVGGAVLTALALIPFSLAFAWGGTAYEWTDPLIMGLFVLTVVFIILLVVVERKAADPIFPGYLFGNKNYMLVFFIAFAYSGICAVGLFLPTSMQQGLGFTATESSMPTVVNSLVCIVVTSFVGARFAKSQRAKGLLALETIVALIVGLFMAFLTPGVPLGILCAAFGLLGMAQSIHQVVAYSWPSVAMEPKVIAEAVAFVSFGTICSSTIFNAILGALMNIDVLLPLRATVVFAAIMLICLIFYRDKKRA